MKPLLGLQLALLATCGYALYSMAHAVATAVDVAVR